MSINYMISLVVGIMIGFLFRALTLGETTQKAITGWADFVAIRVLLPTHVLLSTQMIDQFPVSLFTALVIGACLPLLTYLVGRALRERLISNIPPSIPLVGATFGGGNRGVLFLSLLMAFHISPEFAARSAHEPTLYDYFAVMDLAYFLVFLAVLPTAHYATTSSGQNQRKENWISQFVSAGIVLISFLLAWVGSKVLQSDFWSTARSDLGFTVTAMCTALVIVHARWSFATDVFRSMGIILITRFIVLGFFALLASAFAKTYYADVIHILVPLGIFLLVPPSSYVPSIIGQYEEAPEVQRAATLALSWNVIFLVMVFGALVAGIVRVLTSL